MWEQKQGSETTYQNRMWEQLKHTKEHANLVVFEVVNCVERAHVENVEEQGPEHVGRRRLQRLPSLGHSPILEAMSPRATTTKNGAALKSGGRSLGDIRISNSHGINQNESEGKYLPLSVETPRAVTRKPSAEAP
jgi:hypothetical protein